VKGAFVPEATALVASPALDLEYFRQHPDQYTIVDVRNASEVKEGSFFDNSINIPLPELRERAHEVPTDKPVVVHCAGGYRSAIGSSILEKALPQTQVLDLSEAVNAFKK
jgi:rhodanese-related sulfurtransferase